MTYDAHIERMPIYALFDLKGPKKDLGDWSKGTLDFPDKPNTLKRVGNAILCHVGPDRWLLRDSLENEVALTKTLKPDDATD